MASVKSLGLHEPAGLRHAIQEQILPPNPKPSDYRWEISTDLHNGQEIEDELLVTDTCVIWSRGQLFRKAFRLDLEKETITHALLTYFPASEHGREPEDATTAKTSAGEQEKSVLSKALVVFLKTQAHIYFLEGTSHVVHMPFEVESACAAPQGVIIQRKQRGENFAPVSLKFPRVPPNSFVSSQVTDFAGSLQRGHPSSPGFSVDGLGQPKTLPLRLSSTLGNMWDSPMEQPESRWPRLVCLTDPLLELGLLVAAPETAGRSKAKRNTASKLPKFLDPSEEILHIEKVYDTGSDSGSNECLTLAVTINRDANTYSIWRLDYLRKEDPFTHRAKKTRSKSIRRRSSMQPPFTSGATTPVQSNFRESFGAPLPGKRTRARKSENPEKTKDLVASSLEQDAEAGAARRQSRRISSMLARADLSSSQYAEQPPIAGHNTSKRMDSHGSRYGRHSGGGRGSFNYSQTIHPSLNSLLEAPINNVLDELRAGGDFDGFHDMGLDDHNFDGVAQEISFTKIKSLPIDTSNIRYSLSSQPASSQCRVFILTAPPSAVDAQQRTQLVIGIQDTVEKKLHLITVYFQKKEKPDITSKASRKPASLDGDVIVPTVGELRHAEGVVDSCKIEEGDLSMIFILSEKLGGGHELSIQAPWEPLTTITLPLLFLDNVRSLQFNGRAVDRDLRQQKSETISCENGSIANLAHSRSRGTVDLVDRDGRFHQIRIQLQPASPMVRRVLDVCRNVLPSPHGESILGGWWHVMHWYQQESIEVADVEWSCLVIMMLALYLALAPPNLKPKPGGAVTSRRKRRTASSSFSITQASEDWATLRLHEAKNSMACPEWMLSPAWEWALDQMAEGSPEQNDFSQFKTGFMASHIRHAKKFMASTSGEAAFGNGDSAYLPTALKFPSDLRRRAASDVVLALHLLLEEQKLDIMTPENGTHGGVHLRVLLCQITRWLEWNNFSTFLSLGIQEELDASFDSELNLLAPIAEPAEVPCILEWAQSHLTTSKGTQFPTLADMYYDTMRISERSRRNKSRFVALTPRTFTLKRLFTLLKPGRSSVETVEAIHKAGITVSVMESLPEALLVPIRDAIARCQPHPPTTWPSELFELVNRSDMNLILTSGKPVRSHTAQLLAPTHTASWDVQMLCQSVDEYNSTGIDESEASDLQAIIRTLFKDDRRLNEAQDILSTHKARAIHLDRQLGATESEYLEQQKEVVSRVATGTLAIPAGRGLLYYSLRFPLLTQKFHIGGFNLNCVVKPTNVTVGVDKTQFTEEKVCWGFFHQGVSAGLSISPHAKGIDTSWILYNKPGQDLSNRHAGFLLALGLNGHLKDVAKWVAFKYLTPRHTMTSIGLLLGLAASYMGTMDSLITRLLSVHVTRMLPRGAAELNLSPMTQTSGIMGIGLLYCNSQHRRMSEVMMSEIQHIDEEDEEEPLRSEGYRLAAGFALGFINLGRGSELRGLHDMKLTEKLVAIATATKKVEVTHILDRAAAGAVMAVALMYMKSEDAMIARKIDVPDSVVQFDYVRPDILMLRALAKNLILWGSIRPTGEWVRDSLPREYRAAFPLRTYTRLTSKSLPFFAILAGTAFALGLRFAGSANTQARDLLISLLDDLIRITRLESGSGGGAVYDEELARSYARTAQDVVAVSCALVMAGTGDLALLRRLRSLHGHRPEGSAPYGSHLAAHLAVGALFLSCGTATFGTRDEAVASLLVAFYPLWPCAIGDNKSHLQAFRHFWVLAVDERCLVTRDMSTSQPVSVAVRIEMRAGGEVRRADTPCLLPPLEDIRRICTDAGPAYWDVELDFDGKAEAQAQAGGGQAGERERRKGKMRVVYLQRRPPVSSPFSTLDTVPSPIRWLFTLPSLNLTPADRAVVMDAEAGVVSPVDALLELRRGVGRGERSALVGLRLLFEWVRRREEDQGQGKRRGGGEDRASWVRRGVVEGLRGDIFLRGS